MIEKSAAETNLKRVVLELGGKSPNIVFTDADLDHAVKQSFIGLYSNQGQVCCAGSRVFVQEGAHDNFVKKMVEMAKKRKLGNPLDTCTEQGPQVQEYLVMLVK